MHILTWVAAHGAHDLLDARSALVMAGEEGADLGRNTGAVRFGMPR